MLLYQKLRLLLSLLLCYSLPPLRVLNTATPADVCAGIPLLH